MSEFPFLTPFLTPLPPPFPTLQANVDHLIEKMKTSVKRGLVLRWAPALEGRLGRELGSHCGAAVWGQWNCLGWGELWDLGLILSLL